MKHKTPPLKGRDNNKNCMEKAIFTDEELDYIYDNIDLDNNPKLVKDIEVKIRRQIKKYYDLDSK